MHSLSESMGRLTAGLKQVDGECQVHGKQTLYTRSQAVWHCPECAMEERRRKDIEAATSERVAHLHKIARIPERYRGKAFISSTRDMAEAKAHAATFARETVAGRKWGALVLCGEAGTGKTLLASSMAEYLINSAHISVRYATAMGVMSEIREAYDQDGKTENSEIQRFADYDLLIIDEVDQMRGTDNDKLLLTELVNRRYNADRPVCVISNKPRHEIGQFVGARIDDRLCENGLVVVCDWPSFRRAG